MSVKGSHEKRPGCERSLGRLVSLSAEDLRNLKEADSLRGYALPRFNRRTGTMLSAQWRSWRKLDRAGLAEVEGDGMADDLVITDAGRAALRQPNVGYEPRREKKD